MKTTQFDGFQWRIRPPCGTTGSDLESVLRDHMGDIRERLSALAPDDREWFTVSAPGGSDLFVKLFRHDSFLQRSRYTLFGSQARTEWRHLNRLHRRNVRVPPPVALGQRFSGGLLNACVLVTEHIAGRTLREVLREQYGTPHWPRLRSHLWKELATVTAVLIEAGFHHGDYHDQNIVVTSEDVTESGEDLALYVTDLHRAGVSSSLSPREVSHMVAFLLYSLWTVVPLWECRRFYRLLRQACSSGVELPDWTRVTEALQERRREHLNSRTSACFEENEHVTVSTIENAGTVYHDPSVSPERIRNWLRSVNDSTEGNRPTLLKERSDGRVFRINGEEVVIEETYGTLFRRRCQRAIGQSKARKSWKNTYGLNVRDVPVPEQLALVEPENPFSAQSSYFIRTFVPGRRVDHTLRRLTGDGGENGSTERKLLLNELVQHVSSLHLEGIFHKDLKANNVLVTGSSPPWEIVLIDLDRVAFYDRPLPREPRIKNLVQLNASLFEHVSRTERMRAWERYVNWPGVPFSNVRETCEIISERTRERIES